MIVHQTSDVRRLLPVLFSLALGSTLLIVGAEFVCGNSSQPATTLLASQPTTETATPPPTTEPAAITDIVPSPPSIIEQPYATGRRPELKPVQLPTQIVTDEQIGKGISAGVAYLISLFDKDGNLTNKVNDDLFGGHMLIMPGGQAITPATFFGQSYDSGRYALCVYALLQCGMAINDDRLNLKGKFVNQIIARMKAMKAEGRLVTYAAGIRASALALHNRREDHDTLSTDLKLLLDTVHGGCYSYFGNLPGQDGVCSNNTSVLVKNDQRTRSFGDNSNAQYGLLGVWSAAEVGYEIPDWYWQMVDHYWSDCQLDNGQWSYRMVQPGRRQPAEPERPTYSMTMAGLASLFVTHDWLDAPKFGVQVGRKPFSDALTHGLEWMETGDNSVALSQSEGRNGYRGAGYSIYGLERVGLASGFKYFGKHDWYAEMARAALDRQQGNGAFGDAIETCYYLLFLSRGRHPILMNKLRYDGAWANRPRDAANLARFATRELERPLNWQVVPLSGDWSGWTDSPILYLAGHEAPKFKDQDYANLKSFVDAGGLIFTQADGGADPFNKFVIELGKKISPIYEWSDLPLDNELYTLNYKIDPKPKLRCITNGSRILMLHSTSDIAQGWQLRAEKTKRNIFEFGVNLFIYAAGKIDLNNRLNSPFLPEPAGQPTTRMPLARVKYPGNWDPEPYAFTRLTRFLQYQTGLGIAVHSIEVGDLDPVICPLAHLTGTAAYTFSNTQSQAVKKYVEAGGILLIDSCGGAAAFAGSSADLLDKAFGAGALTIMPADHPVLVGGAPGMDALKQQAPLRRYAQTQLGKTTAGLRFLKAGKGQVIYTDLDLTSGLLNTNTWSILGFQPQATQSLLKNLILWTWDGCPAG